MIQKILKRLSDCGIPELKSIKALSELSGSYVNLLAKLPNGTIAKILDDNKTYYCCQTEQTDGGKCLGVAADETQFAVYLYGQNGSDAEIVLWGRI